MKNLSTLLLSTAVDSFITQGDPCIMNVWVHDGSKDLTVNRMYYRELLKDSLDQIFATEYKNMKDCIESKVFGIGLESYTVGSNDFYIGYGASRGKMVTLDTGHFHPTESIADKSQCGGAFSVRAHHICHTRIFTAVGSNILFVFLAPHGAF